MQTALLGTDTSTPTPSATTFVIRQRDAVWHVEDAEHGRGGIFVNLAAAMTFARREVAGPALASLVIVGA